MAKSVSIIATLLLVVLFISAEIPKSEASCNKYLGGVHVYPCKESECEAKCREHYHESCKGECEDHDAHLMNDNDEYCHCYGRS
ncbi:unnamed protein product [Microthlaspi erraticum]|uniref:Knottin scorpion toxin-like domain-containing protein n=1 Tax=Microthlaspi erraticum TaxID=1685480 RepID=A0A6D2HR51_9BRAS|nr:unnamed protein product [Microthlaspi erraticum]